MTRRLILAAALSVGQGAGPSWTLPKAQPAVGGVAFSPDGKLLAATGGDTVCLWNLATGKKNVLVLRQAIGRRLVFSQDCRTLVAGSNVGPLPVPLDAVTLWDVPTGRRIRGFLRGGMVESVALSPDGHLLAAGTFGLIPHNKLKLWDLRTGRGVRFIAYRGLGVSALAFSPDGRKLGVSDFKSVAVADIASRSELWRFRYGVSFLCVAFSPDGRLLAAAHSDGTIRLWDAQSGKLYSQLTGHRAAVHWVAFSPDGKTLASCSNDGTVRVWEVGSGRQLRVLAGHQSWVICVAYSPDGETLASASEDGTVRLWDAATGKEIRSLTLR